MPKVITWIKQLFRDLLAYAQALHILASTHQAHRAGATDRRGQAVGDSVRWDKAGAIRTIVHAILPIAIRPVWWLVCLKHRVKHLLGANTDVRKILLICHNPVAADHLIPIAELLGEQPQFQVRVANDHFPSQEIDKSDIRRVTRVEYVPVLLALLCDWDLIVYVNHPWGFGAWFWPGTPKIYINHGLHVGKINNDLGEDGVYGPHRTTRKYRGLLYRRMFAASEFEREAALAADPALAGRVVVTGSLMADEIAALAAKREQLRSELGIASQDRVVHVVSTWGSASLSATIGDRLLDALGGLQKPTTVLFSLHPRFDKFGGVGRSRREILNQWKSRGVHVDLLNVRWQQFVAVADVAIADHTSLAFYHVLLGRPVIYVPVPDRAFVPGSAFDTLRRQSPAISDLAGLESSLDAALSGANVTSLIGRRRLADYLGEAKRRHLEEIERIVYPEQGLKARTRQ